MPFGLKGLVARLPESAQRQLKRLHYARQIRKGSFSAGEPEYDVLHRWVRPGDWALDIGANIGHYTLRLSELVGPAGRVISVEPTPDSFWLLCANARQAPHSNVTLLNVAASSAFALAGMTIPVGDTGLKNLYMAKLDQGATDVRVLTVPFDCLDLPHRIALVKIDVEGHEAEVLRGMQRFLTRDRPVFILEESSPDAGQFLEEHGYRAQRFPGSPNVVLLPEVNSDPG